MKIQRHAPLGVKGQLEQICETIKHNEQQVVLVNFQMGDLVNSAAREMDLNWKETCEILQSESGISSDTLQTNSRICRRYPEALRSAHVSWSAIKYMIHDLNPKKLRKLGYAISDDEFYSASIKVLHDMESKSLTWTEVQQTDEDGVSLGERMIIQHLG